MKRILLMMALSLVLVSSSGCGVLLLGAAAGAGTVMWVKGVAEGTYEYTIDECWQASCKAFDTLNIHKLENSTDADGDLKRELVGRTDDDDSVTISMKSESTSVTKLTVRVNIFGDKEMSSRIHEEIRKHLPAK